jgi:hypothetical protein
MNVRSGTAAFSIGTVSHNGPAVITNPPTCCDKCRGKPISCRVSRTTIRSVRSAGSRPASRMASSGSGASAHQSSRLESESTQSSESPSALPTSRTADRGRYVMTSAVMAARSRPYLS